MSCNFGKLVASCSANFIIVYRRECNACEILDDIFVHTTGFKACKSNWNGSNSKMSFNVPAIEYSVLPKALSKDVEVRSLSTILLPLTKYWKVTFFNLGSGMILKKLN